MPMREEPQRSFVMAANSILKGLQVSLPSTLLQARLSQSEEQPPVMSAPPHGILKKWAVA